MANLINIPFAIAEEEIPIKIDICSKASLRLGNVAINSLNENTAVAAIAKNLFDSVYLSELANHPWKFALKSVALPLATAEDNQDPSWKQAFSHKHQLPLDLLRLERVFSERNFALYHYKIQGNYIHSNHKQLAVEYVYPASLSILPAYFAQYLELTLAAQLAIPLGEQFDKAGLYSKLAQHQFQNAIYLDSQSQPEESLDLSELTKARF